MTASFLVIDAERTVVQWGDRTFEGQWFAFYAVLALARTEPIGGDEHLGPEAFCKVGCWQNKTINSTRREVWRHHKQLEKEGLANVLDAPHPTLAWRLAMAPTDVLFHPDREAVVAWVAANTSMDMAVDDWLRPLQDLVAATQDLQRGEATEAFNHASPHSDGEHPTLRAWCAHVRGRAAKQSADGVLLAKLYDDWRRGGSAVERSVAARLRAALALLNRFVDVEGELKRLNTLATALARRGDLSALAPVKNVIGVMQNRSGRHLDAVASHLEAVALFGIVGDYPSMQAALYNIANGLKCAGGGAPPSEAVFTVLDLCLDVCDAFGVGDDSIEAEVDGVHWSLEAGDLARAQAYLERAQSRYLVLDSVNDQGRFLRARAAVKLANGDNKGALGDLVSAKRAFVEVGNIEDAKKVGRLIQALEAGVDISRT